jgi:hypothetical protein
MPNKRYNLDVVKMLEENRNKTERGFGRRSANVWANFWVKQREVLLLVSPLFPPVTRELSFLTLKKKRGWYGFVIIIIISITTTSCYE